MICLNEKQAREMVGDWEKFSNWMFGQTAPILEDGSMGYYEYDVMRFIRKEENEHQGKDV